MKINQHLRTIEFHHESVHSDVTSFFFKHGMMMYFAWGILSLFMIVSARYLRVFYKVRMWIHRIFGTIIVILTVFTTVLIYIKEHPQSSEGIGYYHRHFAIYLCISSVVQALGGVINRIILRRIPIRKNSGEFMIGYK